MEAAPQQRGSTEPDSPASDQIGNENSLPSGTPLPEGGQQLVHVGNGLFVEKLCIGDEDAASVEGPPTPDAEEGAKVSMPATKRQRVGQLYPAALASHFARALYAV